MLVDHQIQNEINQGRLIIDPWDPSRLQPASIDLTLDDKFRYYPSGIGTIDLKDPTPKMQEASLATDGSLTLGGHAFALASTRERIDVPPNMVGRIEGKSSLARMGLFVHVTAGFIDPGFAGYVTLELFNGNANPLKLYVGMPICQISFDYSASRRVYDPTQGLTTVHPDASKPYSGKYMNQARGPKESEYFRNFTES